MLQLDGQTKECIERGGDAPPLASTPATIQNNAGQET
jgi:hypothetical protein